MVTCQVTRTELESQLKTKYVHRNTPNWSLNSIKMTDHECELTRNEDFNLKLDVETTPTEIVAAFQSLKRKKSSWNWQNSSWRDEKQFELLQFFLIHFH